MFIMYCNIKMLKTVIIIFLIEHFIGINFLIINYIERIPTEYLCISSKIPTFKCLNDEMIDIQKYIDLVFNGTLLDNKKKYYITENPKISVVISVYNGEAYLKTGLLSIQNQNMKDIEIVIIDDCSKDNSVELIEKLKYSEPRIVLYKNNENRGALYTKCKGVLLSKGKYVLLLDEDDMYIQKEAFSILYEEAERYKLDILQFNTLISKPKIKRIKKKRLNVDNPIVFQPKLSEIMFSHNSKGEIEFHEKLLTNCLIKKDILIKAIREIDDKYMNQKINIHDDFFIYFLLTRYAITYKLIDRFFYLVICDWDKLNKNAKFRNKEKKKYKNYLRCDNYLKFIEFIFNKTENTFYDKQIAFFSFNRWYLSNKCRNFVNTIEKAKIIAKLYIENKFIRDEDKKKLIKFLNENK